MGDLRWKFSRESHNGKGKCVHISCAAKTYSNGLSITSSTLRSQWIHWISHITLTLSLSVYVSLRTQNVLSFTHSCDANSIETYKRTTNSFEFSVLVQSPSNLVSEHRGAEYLKLQILCQSRENHKKSFCLVWMCECVSQSVSIKNSLTLFYHEKKMYLSTLTSCSSWCWHFLAIFLMWNFIDFVVQKF